MGVIVTTFDVAAWKLLFPAFTYLTSDQATMYWTLAQTFNRNDGGGPVATIQMQTTLLNLVTAHLAQLFAPAADGQQPSNLVGRISNASQGSVSVAVENQYAPGTVQWWQQTSYGSAYWVASAPFRTMRYIPGPWKPTEPWPVAGNFFLGANGWNGWWGR